MDQLLINLKNILLEVNHEITPQGCIVIAIIFSMVFFILKLQKPAKNKTPTAKPANNESYFPDQQNIKAIAGDDEITTQLDLARAYIEMDQKDLAKPILHHVIANGNTVQQSEAQQLIAGM